MPIVRPLTQFVAQNLSNGIVRLGMNTFLSSFGTDGTGFVRAPSRRPSLFGTRLAKATEKKT